MVYGVSYRTAKATRETLSGGGGGRGGRLDAD